MLEVKLCQRCNAYLLDHRSIRGWKSCPSCGWAGVNKMSITLEMYLMGRDKLYPQEYNEQLKDNALLLLSKVNQLLNELGFSDVTVSSGWRPSAINSTTPGAAKSSYHTKCLAVDLHDKDGNINASILAKPELLKKYDLWLEDISSTPTWTHLDLGKRSDRPIRVFKP